MRRIPAIQLALVLALVLMSCGGGESDESDVATGDDAASVVEATSSVVTDATTPPATAPPADESSAEDPPSTATPQPSATEEPETEAPPEPAPRPFASLATESTEPGARPLLAWDAVDGATRYRVVVLDAVGDPYWAWTGADTAVNVGGTDDPTTVGAWVFEPMTWTVAALDDTGLPLALSLPAPLEP